jgi:hypothetical protein
VAVWNGRLQIAALILILWGEKIHAIQLAGPDVPALLAGEGALITVMR